MIEHLFPRRRWALLPMVLVLAAAVVSTANAQEQADAAIKQLMAANGLFERGLLKLAAQNYKDFLAKYPAHGEAGAARYGLSICYYRMNQYAETAEQLQEVVKDRKFKQRDEALAVLGHCLLERKEYDKALVAFDDLLGQHAKSKHAELAALNRAQVLYLLGKPDASLSACREFLKKYGSSSRRPTAEYFLACSQEALGKHGDAEETLRNLIKQHKDSPHQADAVLLLGQCMENQGKFDEAVDQYRKFSDAAPRERQGEGYYSLGLALYKAAKYPESIKALSTVLSKHGDSQYASAARLQLGLAQLAGGKADDARETLTKVLKSDKQREPKARYWLAQCDITQGKFQSAREALDAMAKSSPPPENLDAVLYDRAICAMEMGKFDMAAGEFAAFLKQYSKSEQAADALYRQAFCLHKLARYAESQALCEQIAGQKPANVAAATAELSAENLFLLTKYAEAAGSFGDLMKASGGDKDRTLRFTFRLGQCAFLAGDYPKAIGLLKQVAGQPEAAGNEQLREAAFFLGDAQFQTGQYADAAGAFGGYLANKGQRQQEAQFKLGLSQVRARQLDRAEKTLEAMLSESADSPWVMRAMFAYSQLAYHELHKPDKAAGVLQKILDGKAPEDLVPPTMYLLAWIDFDAKKYQQAAERFGDLVKRFEKHELAGDAALQRAICLKEMGKTEEAIELLAQFPKTYPKAERLHEARHLLGTCLALPKIGKQDEAIKVFSALADEKGARTEAVLYELAWAQRAAKATKDATETYQRLLREFPSGKLSAPARTELAELLYLDQKYAEAASLVEKVVADNAVEAKTRAVAQYRLGWCQAKLSEATKAAETFADFVAKYPDHELAPSAMYEAGVAYMQSEKLADAQKRFAALIDKHPKHDVVPFAYLKLGEAQAGTGEYDKSAATYQTFLEKHPETKFAYLAQFGIGWASENLKQYDEARKWYSRVVETHNGETAARAQFQMGECYFAEKHFDRAAAELLKVDIVYGYPKWSARALYEAGRAFEQLNEADQAKAQYELCIKKYKDFDSSALAKKRLKALENP